MEDYIRKAFKSLEDLQVTIEPVKKPLDEAFDDELETPIGEDTKVRELFEVEGSYVLTHEFEDDGLSYSLFFEGLNDGESCDLLFDEFDIENINEVLVEVLDSEHDFIGSVTPEFEVTLDTPVQEVIANAIKVINGDTAEEEPLEEPAPEEVPAEEPSDEPAANEREFIGDEIKEDLCEECDWVEVKSFEDAQNLCKDTKWCIAGKFPGQEGNDSRLFDHYKNQGYKIFVCGEGKDIKGKLVDSEGKTVVVVNANDEVIDECNEKLDESFGVIWWLAQCRDAGFEYDFEKGVYIKDGKEYSQEEVINELCKEPEPEQEIESLQESKEFNLYDKDEVQEADEMLNKSEDEHIEQIVDVAAENEEELEKSYIGSMILQCPTCKTMLYKKPEDLVKSEDADSEVYNVDEECPHCGAKDGFELIGQVASLEVDPFAEPDAPMEDEPEAPAEEPEPQPEPEEPMPELPAEEEAPVEEELKPEDNLEEDTVKQGDKWVNKGKEGTHGEFKTKKAADAQRKAMFANGYHESKECDVKLESFDEKKFDKLVTRYLKENYSNVQNYRTTEASVDDASNRIALEGMVTFKSGKEKPTKFIFEAKELNHKQQLKFVGINEMFTKNKAFTLVGKLNENKLLSESLSYSYKVGDKKVKGKVESLRKK